MKLKRSRDELLELIRQTPVIDVSSERGLSSAQAEEAKKNGLSNRTKKDVTKTYWQIFADNVFTFFNIVYFVIVVLMVVAQMSPANYLFAIPVLCNMFIGLFTDIHTRHLVDKLRLITNPKIRVVRDGKEFEIPVDEVVLNDVVLYTGGDQICADAVVLQGNADLDESLLTGESVRVQKTVGDKVLSGTYLRSGRIYVRVTAVGSANYAESIQQSAKQFRRPHSELKSSCLRIFWTTGIIAMVLGVSMTIVWLVRSVASNNLNYASYQTFVPSLSGSMIAMIPAGLYLLVSLALAISVGRLARKKMNVQELYCVEMLARVDVICFDKTGTITDGLLEVSDVYDYGKFSSDETKGYIASIIVATGDDNQTARCLLRSFPRAEADPIEALPFSSDKKYAAGTYDKIGTFVYGAPEMIPGKVPEIAQNRIDNLAKRGLRVLGVYFSKKPIKNQEIPSDLALIAVIALSDHVKEDAKENIEWFLKNGVQVKVISGDNAVTVAEIANKAGVPHAANFISMEDVPDDAIPGLVQNYSVFGRVKPEQKALIVEALQKQGHKVAMTGDGVNDILALKKADCSITMGSGSAAARNVSHIVSLDNDFSKLPDVVAEGRRAINNLQRSASLFLAKTIFAIVLSFGFLLSQTFGGISYPFAPRNLYVWEIVTIGGGGFFLALQKTNDRVNDTFMSNVLRHSIPGGLVQILAVVIVYLASSINPHFMSGEQACMVSVFIFTALSYCVLFRVSWKFDAYRGTVCGLLTAAGAILFVLDYYYGTKLVRWFSFGAVQEDAKIGIFGLRYHLMNPSLWIMTVVTTACLAMVYLGIDAWLSRKKNLSGTIDLSDLTTKGDSYHEN
ncbi:MAG: HAD-IC family P-type ATPase [Erysipelotrichaceae bacterium]|nr:HAD-IC family P-type ATPase [Erysipelotrichaceae bacterium]